MSRILREIKRWLGKLAGGVISPVSLTISLAHLITHTRMLRKAQVVVIMPEGGFGHTIIGPDVTRRMFPGCRCVFIVLSEYKRHNRNVAALWPDIDVIFLPITFGMDVAGVSFPLPGMSVPLKRVFSRGILRFARMAARFPVLLQLHDLYGSIPLPETFKPYSPNLQATYVWPTGYFKLQREVTAPPVRLPPERRDGIRRELDRVAPAGAGHPPRRRCCLYLRQKGRGSSDITNSRRDGSPLEQYVPAIELLNRSHYQVLLTGDAEIDPSLYLRFPGMLVDSRSIGIDKQEFDLYAATESDIFIGESGGGIHLPGINGIPRLLMNAFPYFFGLPHSWVYYKTVRDEKGKWVHYTKLFLEHAYDYELKGMTIHPNTAEEIFKAVSCFITDISRAGQADPNAHVMSTLPDHTWIKQAGARLSPAWLKLYERSA